MRRQRWTTIALFYSVNGNYLKHLNFTSLFKVLPRVAPLDLPGNNPLLCHDIVRFQRTKLFAKLHLSSQKRQKRRKRHILVSCFSLRARLEIARGIMRRKHGLGFNKSIFLPR